MANPHKARAPRFLTTLGLAALASLALPAAAGTAQDKPPKLTDTMLNEQVAEYDWVRPEADYVRRTVMIPMRDGTKLFTVIIHRKGVNDAPILFTRTPYNADRMSSRNRSQKIEEILPVADAEFVNDGYIRVYQDVRGLDGSEGDYVMNRPLRGPIAVRGNTRGRYR